MRKRRRGFLLEVLSAWVIPSKHSSIKLLLLVEQNEDFMRADSQLLTISVLVNHFLSNRFNLLIPSSCHTSRPPDSTSLLLCCGLTWSESLGPWQRKKERNKILHKLILSIHWHAGKQLVLKVIHNYNKIRTVWTWRQTIASFLSHGVELCGKSVFPDHLQVTVQLYLKCNHFIILSIQTFMWPFYSIPCSQYTLCSQAVAIICVYLRVQTCRDDAKITNFHRHVIKEEHGNMA